MRSLKTRLTAILLAALGGLLALGGGILYPAVRQVLISGFDHANEAKLRALTALPEEGREGINLFFVEAMLSEFQPGPEAEYFQVWLQDGSVLARSPSLGTNNLPRILGAEQAPVFTSVRLPDGKAGRIVGIGFGAEEVTEAGLPSDGYTIGVVLARDTVRLHRVLNGVLAGIVGTGIALMLLAVWMVHAGIRRGLRPIEELAMELRKIDVGSLRASLRREDYPEELRPIVEQLNQLTERIAAGFQRERRLASNAAHELLTPVAELRAMAEAAQQWSADPEATRELAADTLETAQQMEHIVRNLLLLAGAEASLAALRCEEVDLSELLGEVRSCFEETIAKKGVSLGWEVGDGLVVMTDRVLCRSILYNLLDNAVEYVPSGGEIRCAARELDGRLEVNVGNSAPGFSTSDLEHLFEPLWRKDAARTARAHAGLGLSVARTFAEALKAGLNARLAREGFLEFRLHFPIAKEASAVTADSSTNRTTVRKA